MIFRQKGVAKIDIVGLIGLEAKKFEVVKIEEKIINNRTVKIIYIKSKKKKYRCPKCNKFTSSVHDTLKEIGLKYLDIVGYSRRIYI